MGETQDTHVTQCYVLCHLICALVRFYVCGCISSELLPFTKAQYQTIIFIKDFFHHFSPDHKLRLHTILISVRLHFISRVFQEFYTLSYYIIIDTKVQMSVRDKILSVFSDDNYMSFHLKLNLF